MKELGVIVMVLMFSIGAALVMENMARVRRLDEQKQITQMAQNALTIKVDWAMSRSDWPAPAKGELAKLIEAAVNSHREVSDRDLEAWCFSYDTNALRFVRAVCYGAYIDGKTLERLGGMPWKYEAEITH